MRSHGHASAGLGQQARRDDAQSNSPGISSAAAGAWTSRLLPPLLAIACAAAKLSTVAMAASHFIPALGISSYELACYGVFWAAQMAVVVKGIESIRLVEKYAAPVLIILCVSLFVWAYIAVSFFLFLHGRFD